jgi:hypothetical protein
VAACPAPAASAVVTVFTVADLVTPIPDFAFPTTPGHARPLPVPPIAVVPKERVALETPSGTVFLSGHRDVVLPAPVGAAPGAFFRTLPPPVATTRPLPIEMKAFVVEPPRPAVCDEVPPGGVRVVRAEAPSPTAVLIGGLKTCEAPCAPPAACPAAKGVSGDALVRVVTSSVRPASWKGNGGTGTVEFYPVGNSLVVQNSPAVVAEVETLLGTLRKAQERTVCVECKLISVPQELADRLGIELAPKGDGTPRCVTEAQIAQLLEAVQGDRRASVFMAPKLSVFDGQTGRVECGEQRTFTTGIDVRAVNGSSVAVPKQETVQLGTTIQVCPTVSADGRLVQLALSVRQADVSEPVQLMPVTSIVTPVFEGGSQGTPVPFTQFIQQPSIAVSEASCKIAMLDGTTTMVPVGKRMVETRTEFGPPVLSQVPYLSRLFKNVGIARETQHVVAVVTARVVTEPCGEKACCASPAAGVVAEYRKAVAAGKTEEAMRLALKALAADPGCFAK